MSAKHTPGPWNAFNSIKAIGVGSERSDIAWVRFEEYGLIDTARSQEEDKANAHLIAAAPELLEFAKEWLDRQGSDENYMTAKAREAIFKATGKTNV